MNRTNSHGRKGRHKIRALVALTLASCSAAGAHGPWAQIASGPELYSTPLASWSSGSALQSIEAGQTPGSDELRFELRSGFLVVVRGRIGALANLQFVLDTGTTYSMIDTKVADRLALPRQSGTVVNFDREVTVGWTTVPEVQVGPLMTRNLRVMVGTLSQFSEFAEAVDGVIGLDMLGLSGGFRLDFEKKILQFKKKEQPDFHVSGKTLAFIVRLKVQGRPASLILDTGVRDLVLFKDRLHQNLPGLKFVSKAVEAREGWLQGHLANLPGIEVGLSKVQAPVFLIDTAPSSLPPEIDGFLGVRALNVPVVEVNFEKGALSLSDPATMRASLSRSGPISSTDSKAKDVVPQQ